MDNKCSKCGKNGEIVSLDPFSSWQTCRSCVREEAIKKLPKKKDKLKELLKREDPSNFVKRMIREMQESIKNIESGGLY